MEGKLLGLSQPEPLPALLVNHLAPPQSERCFPSEREFGRIRDSVFNSGTSFSTMPKGAKFLAVGKSHIGGEHLARAMTCRGLRIGGPPPLPAPMAPVLVMATPWLPDEGFWPPG